MAKWPNYALLILRSLSEYEHHIPLCGKNWAPIITNWDWWEQDVVLKGYTDISDTTPVITITIPYSNIPGHATGATTGAWVQVTGLAGIPIQRLEVTGTKNSDTSQYGAALIDDIIIHYVRDNPRRGALCLHVWSASPHCFWADGEDGNFAPAGKMVVGLHEVSTDSNLRNGSGQESLSVLNQEASEAEQKDRTQSALDDVLDSPSFKKAPTLRRLLIYLWEQRNSEVSEYAIAIEALGRRADFEPREDATVRVLVSRLRVRLKDFYESEGTALPSRIVIPVGSHQVQVIEAPKALIEEAPDPELLSRVLRSEARNRKLILGQAIAIAVLVLTCIGLAWERNHAVKDALAGGTSNLPVFWRDFLENGKNTRIILPMPVLFGWGTSFLARDVNVNDFTKVQDSAYLQTLVREWGNPTLSQQYVAASDALSSLRLDQYLDPRGLHLSISTTAESPVDTLDRENLIVAGTPRTLAPFRAILNRLSFQSDADKEEVVDLRSGPGAPRKFKTVRESSMRMTTPGIIACLPGSKQGTRILIFVTTYYTSALVSYLTSESGLSEIQAAQRAHGNSPYFEAVILSEINGTTDLRSHLVEFRPISPKN